MSINIGPSNNHIELNPYLGQLQETHENSDALLMRGLFDRKPSVRQHTAKENRVSLPDLAAIPKSTPDEKIIRLIASEMNKKLEKTMDPADRIQYKNDYLISYTNKDRNGESAEEIKLIQTAIKYFNKVLNYKIEAYKMDTGKELPKAYIKLHPHTPHGKLEMTGTDQIIQFFRKDFIKKAFEKGEITEAEAIEFKKYSCDLLKKMYAFEDERQNHDELEGFRKVFNSYTTNELTKDFYHKAKEEGKPMIADKSDKYYFSDKRYRISKGNLGKYDIKLPEARDIYFEIEARAKDSLSIQRKEIFDPKMDSALAASDIGGVRSIGENDDDLNILLAYHLMKYNKNSMRFNKDLLNDFANGEKQEEITGKKYTPEQIAEITAKYLPKVRDKDVLKVKKTREESESQPAQYTLDKDFFIKHGIIDPFVLQQLGNAVQEKNSDLEKEFNEIKKDKDESRKEVLKTVINHTHPEFKEYLQSENDIEILYRVIKKITTLETKKQKLLNIEDIKNKATNNEVEITDQTETSISYKEGKRGKEKTIQIPPSKFEINKQEKNAFYKMIDNKFVIQIDDKTIDAEQVIRLAKTFKNERTDKENDMKKIRQKVGRKIGADDWKEVKLLGKLFTESGKHFSGEHQFVTRATLNHMKPTTVAEVYDSMKAVFEEARCFNILTKSDIVDIIQNRMIPMLEYTKKAQNGMSGSEILETLRKAYPRKKEQEAITEAIFNELTERGLKTLTINGIPQEGFYVKPSYVSRLKRNGLRID